MSIWLFVGSHMLYSNKKQNKITNKRVGQPTMDGNGDDGGGAGWKQHHHHHPHLIKRYKRRKRQRPKQAQKSSSRILTRSMAPSQQVEPPVINIPMEQLELVLPDSCDLVGASVLPFTIPDGSMTHYFLLGLEQDFSCSERSRSVWSDFGGKRDDVPHPESAEQCAGRELEEESLGLVPVSSTDLEKMDFISRMVFLTTRRRHVCRYDTFLCKIDFTPMTPLEFTRQRSALLQDRSTPSVFLEKSRVAYISAERLRDAILYNTGPHLRQSFISRAKCALQQLGLWY